MEITTGYIADYLNGTLKGAGDVVIKSISRIESGKPGTIVFLGNLKYEKYLYTSDASAVILNKSFVPSQPVEGKVIIEVDDAYQAIASLLELYSNVKSSVKSGRSLRASVSWRAKISKGVYIGSGAVVCKGAVIGKGTQVYPQCYVGENVKIGDNTIVFPGVKIYAGSVIGSNCIVHSNAVIGADGFGFAPMPDGSYKKIPQTGNVVIEDFCEIGANAAIDRASIGSTVICKGVKIDNLVHIAHNCEVGVNTVIAAQTGIAGSVKIGSGCMFGGQVGVAGHVTIANKTSVGGQAGVISNIKTEGQSLFGTPAMDAKEYFRAYSIFRKLHKR